MPSSGTRHVTPGDVIHIFLIPKIGDAIIPYRAPDEDGVNCIREPGGSFSVMIMQLRECTM